MRQMLPGTLQSAEEGFDNPPQILGYYTELPDDWPAEGFHTVFSCPSETAESWVEEYHERPSHGHVAFLPLKGDGANLTYISSHNV